MTKSSRRHLRRSAQKILVPTDGHTQIRINQSGWQEIKILLRRSTSMSLVGTNAKWRLTPKTSGYGGRPEVVGKQSKRP
jgi:hypothetical protein